ncbi:MAG: alpha/beta hydrolase [Candidatus Krumholzibacteriales bacterium]
MYTEEPFFFRTGSGPLFGVLYRPGSNSEENDRTGKGLVVCDSLFEEKFWCERALANMARSLAEKGVTVLIFDYYGYANSSGRSEEVNWTTIRRDINSACDLVRGEGVDSIGLLGIRWGAVPACRVASERSDIRGLFLVKPIPDWRKQLQQSLRANVAGQYAIFKKAVMTREDIIKQVEAGKDCVSSGYRMNNIEGYVFSRDFWRDSRDMILPEKLPDNIRQAAVFHIPEREGKQPVAEKKVVETFSRNGSDCELVDIPEDNAFWLNNRIFTSTTPNFYRELALRLEKMEPAVSEESEGRAGEKPDISLSVTRDGIKETVVDFENRSGDRLYGVMYLPEGEMKQRAYLFTHGGLIGMNGAFRFNTRAARRLAAGGYPSLCCDTHGIGRSGGKIENIEQRVLFRRICYGLFADDVLDCVELLRSETGDREMVLFGVCGGAITNIIAHGKNPSVDTSVLLSIPVMLPSLSYEEVRMSEGYARFYLGLYLKKIFKLKAWYRFITFKSDHRIIFKSFLVMIRGILRKLNPFRSAARNGAERPAALRSESGESASAKKDKPKSGLSVAVPGAGSDLQFNEKFLESFRSISENGGRGVFVFGGNDNFKWEFFEEFKDRMPEEYGKHADSFTIKEIEHANHMYTLREWQDRIIGMCLDGSIRE